MKRILCPKYQPWTTTNQGEINDACIDREKRIIKQCDGCVEKVNPNETIL